jgi:hypothetical protein
MSRQITARTLLLIVLATVLVVSLWWAYAQPFIVRKAAIHPPMPHTVYIAGDTWWIMSSYLTQQHLGETQCIGNIIWVNARSPEREKVATIIHEVQHAMTCDAQGVAHNEYFNNPPNPIPVSIGPRLCGNISFKITRT